MSIHVPFTENGGTLAYLSCSRFEGSTPRQHILIRATDQFVDSMLHWHDFIQVWYVFNGMFEHGFHQQTELLKEGNAVIVPPFCAHSVCDYREKPLHTACFEFSVEAIETIVDVGAYRTAFLRPMRYRGRSCFVLSESVRQRAEKLMKRLIADFHSNPQKCLELRRDEVSELLLIFAKQATEQSTVISDTTSWRSFKIIRRAISYTIDHYQESIQIEDICRYCHMSRSHFSRMFKEVTGNTFHEFLAMLRVSIARKYMAYTDLDISNVINKSEFHNRANFYRKFQKYSPLTPQMVRDNR